MAIKNMTRKKAFVISGIVVLALAVLTAGIVWLLPKRIAGSDERPIAYVDGEAVPESERYVQAYLRYQNAMMEEARAKLEEQLAQGDITEEQYRAYAAHYDEQEATTAEDIRKSYVELKVIEKEAKKRNLKASIDGRQQVRNLMGEGRGGIMSGTTEEEQKIWRDLMAFIKDAGFDTFDEYVDELAGPQCEKQDLENQMKQAFTAELSAADKADGETVERKWAAYKEELCRQYDIRYTR